MSDDLISRTPLIDQLETFCGKQRYLIPENVWEIIENAPTAFYKEKVIEEILNASHGYYNVEVENEIVEIVEKGGIE